MSQLLAELETLMGSFLSENRKLLEQLERQQTAMKAMDLEAMDHVLHEEEATRLRIATLENRRKTLVRQLAASMRVNGEPTLAKIAELHGPRGAKLMKLRNELRQTIAQVTDHTHVSGKLAGAVLGHLNTVVRLFASAVERAGTYTRSGIRHTPARIGVMEAVG
jgi:hypothetical protein